MFLIQYAKPSYEFFAARSGISNTEELKQALKSKLATIDLNVKKRDFEHLLFDSRSAGKFCDLQTLWS